MMMTRSISILASCLLAAGWAIVSCQTLPEEENTLFPAEEIISPAQTVSYHMVMNGQVRLWDSPATKADGEWQNGDRLYIQLVNEKGSIPAMARYVVDSKTKKEDWEISMDAGAAINSGAGTSYCYFFPNAQGYYNNSVTLDHSTRIYEGVGSYQINGNTIILNVNLSPMTGRIKFTPSEGSNDYGIRVFGLYYYSRFNPSDLSFEISEKKYIDSYVDEYIYGSIFNYDNTLLLNNLNDGSYYERSFDDDILTVGHSYSCVCPSEKTHNEWRAYRSILYPTENSNYNSYSFIPAGSFMMGGGNDNAFPIHEVTLTHHFYMGQSETPRYLWYKVMGEPVEWENDNLPITGKTWNQIQEFIFALNTKYGVHFRLPTEAEWEWACRGGNLSNGHLYSGSNDVNYSAYRGDEIARPERGYNEFSLVDMSGNAGEFCQDWYSPYTDEYLIDPTGPESGEYHVVRGGDIKSSDEEVTVYARTYREDSDLQYTGFRLAMDIPGPDDSYDVPPLFVDTNIHFEDTPVGLTSTTYLEVRASRAGPVTFSITANAANGFTFSPSGPITVPAGGVQKVKFTFSPTEAKSYHGIFRFSSDKLSEPITISVSGNAMAIPENALVVLARKYQIHHNSDYCYPRMTLLFDNGTKLHTSYFKTQYYDGDYRDVMRGIYVYPSIDDTYENRTDTPWYVADVLTDRWVNEILILEGSLGSNTFTVSYYINGVLHSSNVTMNLAEANSFTLQFSPYGWYSGHRHWMDNFNIVTAAGFSYFDDFDSNAFDYDFWVSPISPSGVRVDNGIMKLSQEWDDGDFKLNSKSIPLK